MTLERDLDRSFRRVFTVLAVALVLGVLMVATQAATATETGQRPSLGVTTFDATTGVTTFYDSTKCGKAPDSSPTRTPPLPDYDKWHAVRDSTRVGWQPVVARR